MVIYVVAFDPIKIQTRLAPQNDCQHLNFVKDNYVVPETITRNGGKKPNFFFIVNCIKKTVENTELCRVSKMHTTFNFQSCML